MAKGATKRESVARPATIRRLIARLGGLPAPDEREDELWLYHVRVGEMFNRAVAHARMASYFESAVGDVFPTTRTFASHVNEEEYGLDYIIPGDVPEAKAGRLVYSFLFRKMKARDKAAEELHAIR